MFIHWDNSLYHTSYVHIYAEVIARSFGFRTMIISFEEAGDYPAAIKSTPFPYDKCYTCIYIYIQREREIYIYIATKKIKYMETWKYKVGLIELTSWFHTLRHLFGWFFGFPHFNHQLPWLILTRMGAKSVF